jgi:hypothetical protein
MSILEAVWIKTLHRPSIGVRLWPWLKLGRAISDTARAYGEAVSIPYLIAFGLRPHVSQTREPIGTNEIR